MNIWSLMEVGAMLGGDGSGGCGGSGVKYSLPGSSK